MTRVILVLLLLNAALCQAAEVVSYESALKLYQEQKYTEAEAQFRAFAMSHPTNKFAHYNWGLAAYQIGLKGMAVAAWRRALNLDPDFSPALAAMNFARTEMPSEVFTAAANRWEELRSAMLDHTTLDRLFGLTVLLFIFAGILGLRYFGARHRAFRDELPLPPFPTIGALFGAGFFIMLALTMAKYVADNEERATVVKTGVAVRSGPNDQDNALFEIIEGAQVIVRQQNNNWTMITYPGGLSGWVPADALFVTSRKD